MNRIVLAVSLTVSLLAFGAAKEPKTVAAADVAWSPVDPKNPTGLQMSVVNGNPQKGAATFYLKIPAGADSGLHSHTADYWGFVVQGSHNHYKESPADGKPLAPGSYWFQPGKQLHGDVCAPGADCIILLNMAGKQDFIPGPKAKADAKPAEGKPEAKPADAKPAPTK
jgi:hypothetical protein